MKMVKALPLLLLCVFLCASSQELEDNQDPNIGCLYKVTIKTSCNSTSYTRDNITLKFGDRSCKKAIKKFDPRVTIFEWCSTHAFIIRGPYMNDICYVYFRKSGIDGWKPESIKIEGQILKRTASFNFNVSQDSIPDDVWYGYNRCYCVSNSELLSPVAIE